MARPEIIKTELGKRLRAVRAHFGDPDRDAFAKDVGLSPKTLANYERGDTQPDAGAIAAYRASFSIDTNWLLTGDGEMFPSKGAGERGRATEATELDQPDFIRLPVYNEVAASAGPGAVAVSEHPDSVVAFARRFLRDQGAVPERCSIIRARGDSMAPTIPDASILIVDHSQAEVANGCIMVISVGDDLLVKRVRRRLDGLIDLVSDNPSYPPETIGRDTVQQLRVVGRVVYFCRVP